MSGVLYRDAALVDGRSAQLRVGVSVLVENDRISWIRPAARPASRRGGRELAVGAS